jgi:alpha-aminoadipate carrier protein LysW
MNENVECPVCGFKLSLDERIVLNELVDCYDCSSELEVICLNPLTLKEAPMEEEDWGE